MQLRLVRRARAQILRRDVSASERVRANKSFEAAQAAFQRMWTAVWSTQRFINNCTNTVVCKNVDISQSSQTIAAESANLTKLLGSVVRQLRNLTGDSKAGGKLLKANARLVRLNNTVISEIPKTSSECATAG